MTVIGHILVLLAVASILRSSHSPLQRACQPHACNFGLGFRLFGSGFELSFYILPNVARCKVLHWKTWLLQTTFLG